MSRRFLFALLVTIGLLAAACGDDSGGGSDGADGADAPAATGSDGDASGGDGSGDSTPTTEALPETALSIEGLHVSRVTFGADGAVTLTNSSSADIDLDGVWLCNRPTYLALSGTVPAGGSIDIPAADFGTLDEGGGEAALYTSDTFDSPDAIIDYVQWGSGGGRAGVADDAGLWPADATVAPFEGSIELFGAPGDPEAWG